MKKNLPDVVEAGRVRSGQFASRTGEHCGACFVHGPLGDRLRIIFSDELGWEHVSVSTDVRCPTWDEMAWVKDLFWKPTEVVMQLHVAARDHINHHRFCLHLWRPVGQEIPLPDSVMVGPKNR